MIRTCSSLLPSGRPCQAPARRHSHFCRHHDPAHPHPARSRTPKQPQPATGPDPLRWIVAASWRTYPKKLANATWEQCDDAIEDVLEALTYRNICHRSAGRIFEAIADRRLALAQQKRAGQLREFCDSLARQNPEALKDKDQLFEALSQLPLTELSEFQGLLENSALNSNVITYPQP